MRPRIALITQAGRTLAAREPAMTHTALLSKSRFVLEPERQALAGMLGCDSVEFGSPLLQRLPGLPGSPSGARGALFGATRPACASAWTCAPRDNKHPSELRPRGRARPRSRLRGRSLQYPDRPEPVGATRQIDLPSASVSVLGADDHADRPDPRHCSAPRRRATPAVPYPPVVPPPLGSCPPRHWRSPASEPPQHDRALAGRDGGVHPMIDPSVSSAVCHSPVLPQRSDRHRIRGPRAAPNHVRVSDYAGRYNLVKST